MTAHPARRTDWKAQATRDFWTARLALLKGYNFRNKQKHSLSSYAQMCNVSITPLFKMFGHHSLYVYYYRREFVARVNEYLEMK